MTKKREKIIFGGNMDLLKEKYKGIKVSSKEQTVEYDGEFFYYSMMIAPNGYALYNNKKSKFGKGYKSIIVKIC